MLIRASAGTGKTYSLSNRYLTLLAMGAQPQTMLATTFTRKAAGEILERILKRLATAARDDASAAQLAEQLHLPLADLTQVRRMLNDVTQSLHHLSVSTIDSFFHRMVQCFRYELDIPPGVTIIADGDPVAVQLRGQAI
ncbi:MAG: UvrD-helicase domain-containing protein, partial [Phycisphaeraceae bacterium]|nr:UvrD-helicase domain-containing protein [Phycisphaeraceae bacterium]